MKRTGAVEALFMTQEPADLGPQRRAGVWTPEEIELRTAEAVTSVGISGRHAECLRALVLLWHDRAEEAHLAVQDLPGGDAAWIHGIVHRREPDFSNAHYWFHRIGSHRLLDSLAEAAAPILAGHASLPFRLIREGKWDPMAFIDAVATTTAPEGGPEETVALLRELQSLEIRMLARHLAGE